MTRLMVILCALLWAVPVAAQPIVNASALRLGVTGATSRATAGSGSPEGVVTGPVGSRYIDITTGLSWRKATGTGNTGWVATLSLAPCGSAGMFLRSTGSAWGCSTLVLPNTITAGQIPYATGANTIGSGTGLTFDGLEFNAVLASSDVYMGYGYMGVEYFASDTFGGEVFGAKARGAVGSPSIVASGDVAAQFAGYAYDGAASRYLAQIRMVVDGTPGASDMPGRLSFWTTPDGSATPLERMRIDNAGHVLPGLSDTYDLGSASRLWRQGYISTLNATVFATTTQTLFGGYSTIGHDAGDLGADVSAVATTVNFGKAMTPDDFILIRAHDTGGVIKAEYIQVLTLDSGTTYNVTRDLAAAHGTDPAWAAGTPYLVLGQAGTVVSGQDNGEGRIDLLAHDGHARIVIGTQGATYNAFNVRTVLGNMNSYCGYAVPIFGMCVGDPINTHVTIDGWNGFRIRNGSTNIVTVDTAGAAAFVGSLTVNTAADYGLSSAVNLKRGTAATSLDFGATGDIQAVYGMDAGGTHQTLRLHNKIIGGAGGQAPARVELIVQGWENVDPAGSTTQGMFRLESHPADTVSANLYSDSLVLIDPGSSVTYTTFAPTSVLPTDNALTLGGASNRWSTIYGMTVRADTAFNINGTTGMTRTCNPTGGNMVFSGGILTDCVAADPLAVAVTQDDLAALWREIHALRSERGRTR